MLRIAHGIHALTAPTRTSNRHFTEKKGVYRGIDAT